MKFMPFDLDYHLKLYNITEQTTKTRQDFNFLQALNENSTTALSLATELLHKSAQLGTKESQGTKTSLFDNVVTQMDNSDYQGVRSSLKQLAKLIEEDNLQSWYIEQHRRLSSPELWEQISTNPMTKQIKAQILNLKTQWTSAQAKYSAHSVSALCFAAENILSLLQNYYYFAAMEFRVNRHKLPKPIRKAYKEYLIEAQKKLRELNEDFCQSMLLRLQLAVASSDITYNDHIHYTGQLLDKHKLIKQQRGLPSYRRNDLSADHFQRFLRKIIQCGTPLQRKALDSLIIFSQDEHYISWQNDKAIILASRAFHERGLVPYSAPWFPNLFKQRHFRYQFFERNVWLFSSLRLIEKHPVVDRDIASTLSHLKEIEDKLNEANQEIQANPVSGVSRLFSYKIVLFKHEWSQYFQDSKMALLKKKIAFITSVHQDLNRHNATFLETSPLKKILDEVTESLSHIHLPAQQCEAFFLVKAALLSKQNASECLLRPNETQRAISTNPFDTPTSKPESSKNPFDAPPKSTQKAVEMVDTTLFELLKNLRLMELDLANFQEMISSIKQSMTSIAGNKGPREEKMLKNAIDKIFTQYLKKYTTLKSFDDYEKVHEKFLAIETLLLAFADEHIRTRIQSIVDCRQESNFWFSVQLKCRSYLASYQQKMAPFLIANSVVLNAKSTNKEIESTTHQSILVQ